MDDDDAALQRYQTLLNSVADGIYQLDADGRFVAVNDAVVELTGYSREKLLGTHISLLLDDDDVQRVEHEIRERLTEPEGGVSPFELAVTTADGNRVLVELQISLLVDDGRFHGTVGSVRNRLDTDDQKTVLESAQASYDSITTVLDEANIGVFVLDDEFEITWADETVGQFFGLDRTEIIGRDNRRVVEETIAEKVADSEQFAEAVLATYDGTNAERFECKVTSGDDRAERWLEHQSQPIESGQYAGGRIEFYYDVSNRKRSEDARQETEEQFRSLVDAVEEYAIFRLDRDGRVISWNEGAKNIKGYESEEILGEHFSTFYTDEDRAAGVPEENLARAIESGSIEDEGWRIRKDGARFWANVTITAIRDDDGTHQGYLKVTRDMTDRYEREQELERRLQRIFGRISDAFYALDEDFQFTHVNERAEQILDVDGEEILGRNVWAVFPEYQNTAFEEQYREALASQEPVSFEQYFSPNDAWYEVKTYPSETGLSVYFQDITERKERERELERRARQQQVVADIGQLALESDDLDELMHEAARQVADVLDNDYCKVLDLDRDAEELLLRQGVGWREGIVGTATVSSIEDRSQAAVTLANEEPIVVQDLASDDRISGPELLTSHDVCSGISTIIGSIEEPWGILGTHDTDRQEFTTEDVNFVKGVANVLAEAIERERYQNELEQLVDDLEESNERLEQFAYAASHDLQEPLRMVTSYLQLIEKRYDDVLDEDGREFLDFAVDGADRMRDMIDALLEYSRIETQGDPFEPVDLETVLEETIDNLQIRIEETNAEIAADSLPRVYGDSDQLRQVFQNLLSNAIKYSGDAPPQVHVSAEHENGRWRIAVRDEGIGVDPEQVDRIFEVFQRLHTHDEHAGTGIGLALCQRIVERHGGTIRAESEPGEGSTFYFTLPASEQHA